MIAFGAFLGPIIGGYCAHLYFAQINFTAPFLLSAILSYIFLKEKITPTESLGLLILGVGIAVIIYSRVTNS